MYVYIGSEPGLWTVGFYAPDGKWNPESDHESEEGAAKRVHYLNGGDQTEAIEKRLKELEKWRTIIDPVIEGNYFRRD